MCICVCVLCICIRGHTISGGCVYVCVCCVHLCESSGSVTNQLLTGGNASTGTTTTTGADSSAMTIGSGGGAAPEIPKSPPKWPLRPGVLVHVKGDTKQNICAARSGHAQRQRPPPLPPPQSDASRQPPLNETQTTMIGGSPLNKSGISYASIPAGRPQPSNVVAVGPGDSQQATTTDGTSIRVEEDDDNQSPDSHQGNTMDELATFTSSNFIERILKRLRWKRERPTYGNRSTCTNIENRRKARKRHLLRPKTGLFGSCKSTNSNTELFDSLRYRPTGLKYPSSGNICLSFLHCADFEDGEALFLIKDSVCESFLP